MELSEFLRPAIKGAIEKIANELKYYHFGGYIELPKFKMETNMISFVIKEAKTGVKAEIRMDNLSTYLTFKIGKVYYSSYTTPLWAMVAILETMEDMLKKAEDKEMEELIYGGE